MAVRLCEALVIFWDVRGLYSEARAFLEQALASGEGVAASVRARALNAAGGFAYNQGDVDRAEALVQESLVLYRRLEDTRGIASSLRWLADLAQTKGNNNASACLLVEESLALYREVGDKEAIAWLLGNLSIAVSNQGEYKRGRTLIEESLAMFREQGNQRGIAFCLRQSALLLFWVRGDQATILARLEESLAISRELGNKDGIAFCSLLAGCVAFSQGDTVTAQTLVEQSLTLWQEMGSRWFVIWPIATLGRIKAYQGDFAAALAFHEASLTRASELNDYWLIAYCLEGWAIAVAAQGEHAWAAHLWGAAESLRERCGIPLNPAERVDYEPAVASARVHLGEQAFAAAWAEGRTMTLEQVLAAPE